MYKELINRLRYFRVSSEDIAEAATAIEELLAEREAKPPIVRCKNCVYWQDRKILLDDGTYRDYLPGEYESGSMLGGVTSDVGINVGSHCTRRNFEGDRWWCGPNDFCSFGKTPPAREKEEETYVMVKITQSLAQWLSEYHSDILPLIILGHIELFTPEMQVAYLDWCKTDEGRKYLVGGECYKEDA